MLAASTASGCAAAWRWPGTGANTTSRVERLRRPALPGARSGMGSVDGGDRALDRRPQPGDLGGGEGIGLDLAGALAGGEGERQAGALTDLAGPDRDLVAVEEGARLRHHRRLLVVALGGRG